MLRTAESEVPFYRSFTIHYLEILSFVFNTSDVNKLQILQCIYTAKQQN